MVTIPDRLPEILARLAAATPGPWRSNAKGKVGEDWLIGFIVDCGEGEWDGKYSDWIVTTDCLRASQCVSGGAKEDAEFIAHAPTDIAWLAGEVERLRKPTDDALYRIRRELRELGFDDASLVDAERMWGICIHD